MEGFEFQKLLEFPFASAEQNVLNLIEMFWMFQMIQVRFVLSCVSVILSISTKLL